MNKTEVQQAKLLYCVKYDNQIQLSSNRATCPLYRKYFISLLALRTLAFITDSTKFTNGKYKLIQQRET